MIMFMELAKKDAILAARNRAVREAYPVLVWERRDTAPFTYYCRTLTEGTPPGDSHRIARANRAYFEDGEFIPCSECGGIGGPCEECAGWGGSFTSIRKEELYLE